MVKSMTGFGRYEHADGKRTITAEIRAVNHRYCEISVRLPRKYGFAEERIKAAAKEKIRRGKVEIYVAVDSAAEEDTAVRLNFAAAKQYYDSLRELRDRFRVGGEVRLEFLAQMPGVMETVSGADNEEELLPAFETAVREAVLRVDEMRSREGEKLAGDMAKRGRLIRDYADEIESFAPEIVKSYAEKLRERIRELVRGEAELPEERIIVEAALFADKINVTEEIVRLRSHVAQLLDILSESGPANGKKIDFLIQEMNREANTIGAKANDIKSTGVVLEMKSEIEKIREQAQNVE